MPGDMLHLTLNTGYPRESPRSEVGDDVIEMMRPLCRPGTHPLPGAIGPDWTVQVASGEAGGLLFMVFHNERSVVACGVAGDDVAADEMWPILERFYLDLTDQAPHRNADWQSPQRPASTPWCAVVMVTIDPSIFATADWLDDFERCLAWTWLETQ
jgi:hypothetical protein